MTKRIIQYPDKANKDLLALYLYLQQEWGIKTVDKLDKKIEKTLDLIAETPEMYPPSAYRNNTRRCVISKQTSIYYRIRPKAIEVLTIFDMRQHPSKLKL